MKAKGKTMMIADMINMLIIASQEALKWKLGVTLPRGRLKVRKNHPAPGGLLTVTSKLTGTIDGYVALGFEKQLILTSAKGSSGSGDQDQCTEQLTDLVKSLGGIVMGRIKTNSSQQGVMVSEPQIVPEGSHPPFPAVGHVVCLLFDTDRGKFVIQCSCPVHPEKGTLVDGRG